jgi:hypothetical protein
MHGGNVVTQTFAKRQFAFASSHFCDQHFDPDQLEKGKFFDDIP